MSNGVRCCLLGPCCPPPVPGAPSGATENWEAKRKKALATMIVEGDSTVTDVQAAKVAAYLYSQVGFVPPGVDIAAATLYRPLFEKALAP